MAYDADDPNEASSPRRAREFIACLGTIMRGCQSRMPKEVSKWAQSEWAIDLHIGYRENDLQVPLQEHPSLEDVPYDLVQEVWKRAELVASYLAQGHKEAKEAAVSA